MLLTSIKLGPLTIEKLELPNRHHTCVLGCNASGKSILAELLAGTRLPESGKISDPPTSASLISFESLQTEYEREIAADDTDFLDRIDYGTNGSDLLAQSGANKKVISAAAKQFGITHLLKRGCRQFSTGEFRRVYLVRELLKRPRLLVLDEPYDGLDQEARAHLSTLLETIAAGAQTLCIMVNRFDEIPTFARSLIILERGKVIATGPLTELLASPAAQQLKALTKGVESPPIPELARTQSPVPKPLIRMRNCSVRYQDIPQFSGFDWQLDTGDHTFISGPNGSGKSTLLGLITGDHPQCYVNELEILGYKRGTGESIWDIKRNIGIVSSSLHRDYRVGSNLETTVVSGFYDSIGLYQQPSTRELSIARQWLDFFGMISLARLPWRSLSYGQQRLGLIARALVKQPPLLLLDEPTQGLDDLNRHLTLSCLERLATLATTTVVLVSHLPDERLSFFTRHLIFLPDKTGTARFVIQKQT